MYNSLIIKQLYKVLYYKQSQAILSYNRTALYLCSEK